MKAIKIFNLALALSIAALLGACGGGGGGGGNPAPTFSIGGSVSGLAAATSVVLQDNGGDNKTISANGSFTFSTSLASGSAYAVTVLTQPAGQTCSVSNGSGTVASANVSNVAVTCVPITSTTFSIGGSVSGLATSTSVVLQDNGGDNKTVSVNGNFTFSTPIASGLGYAVMVLTQPTGQTCSVTNGSGTVASANVSNVAVTCVPNTPATFSIGGSVSGLAAATSVVLQDNGGDNKTVSANGSFTFSMAIASGSTYAVTVLSQPAGQTCSVSNGNGTVGSANVTNVAVTCVPIAPSTFSIGGNVSGLAAATSLVIQDNGGDNKTVSANGSFTFTTAIASGSTYAVTVLTQPAGQTCSVSNGSGTVASANVTNVAVTCVAVGSTTFSIGGSVSGLSAGVSIVLQDNGGDNKTISTNGSFAFTTAIASGSTYSVTVLTQPTGQNCSVTNGSGTVASANVTNVAVTCVAVGPTTFSIGGSVSGLAAATSVVLQNNGGDNKTVSANGSFTFISSLASGSAYAVTVLTHPAGQTCSVTNGSGTVGGANVTNVAITCVPIAPSTFSIGGSVSGLAAATSVVLQDNGGDNKTISVNGSFAFTTAIASGSTYAVTVLTQPAGQTCSVTSGSGTVASANVTNVAVTCVAVGPTTFSIGGSVSGLPVGASIVLQDNGGDNTTVSANGNFNFNTPIASGSGYAVTVLIPPAVQSCAVSNGSGTVASVNVINIAITCTAAPVPPASGTPTAVIVASQAVANQTAQATVSAASDLSIVSSMSGIPLGIQISPLPLGVTSTFNITCPAGGSATAVYSSATGSMTVVGDTMTETFTNCSANAGSSVSGTEVATVTSWVSATNFAYTLMLTNITTTTNGVTYGPYNFSGNYSYANSTYSYSYTSTNNNTIVGQPVVTRSGNNATIVAGTSHVNSPSGGWYNAVYSNWTWDITTGKAASGSVAINGANGDTVVVTALGSGQYNVDITVGGVTTSYSVTI